MEEEKIKEFIKSNLKIFIDIEEVESKWNPDAKRFVATLMLGGEKISESKIWI